MKDLVLNIEQCRHLQELGLDMSDAKLCFYEYSITFNNKGEIYNKKTCLHEMEGLKLLGAHGDITPTYTLQEILDRLPIVVYSRNSEKYELFIDYSHRTISYYNWVTHKCYADIQAESKEILDSAYEALCWAIKEGHLKIDK